MGLSGRRVRFCLEVIANALRCSERPTHLWTVEELGYPISAPIATMLMQIHSTERVGRDSKKNFNLRNRWANGVFLTNLPSMIVRVCSMAGQNATPVPKSRVMNASANKLNGLLCVDALSGEEFFRLSPGSKKGCVWVPAELCLDCGAIPQTLHHSRQ